MTEKLAEVSPPEPLYRLGRAPDPWAWPDWRYSQPDGTFGSRFDDPEGRYRVLYACSIRVATFVEMLTQFRPDPAVVAGLAEIDGDEDALPPGTVPRSWLERRCVGAAAVRGRFVDIGHSRSLATLNRALGRLAVEHGLRELDAAAIRLSAPRSLTQRISRWIYKRTAPDGTRRYAGIRYPSRLGDDLENWAIFEPADLTPQPAPNPITADDPDLQAAVELHGLRIGL